MGPVIAAIAAGLLAGAVALYRERRTELIEFLVAARVMRGHLALLVAKTGLAMESDSPADWRIVNDPDVAAIAATWSAERAKLAAHLPIDEWDTVENAVNFWQTVITHLDRDPPPANMRAKLEFVRDEALRASRVLDAYATKPRWWRNPRSA